MTIIDNPTWTLVDRLKKSRLIAGLEQIEMAERIGVARNTVSNWENGRSEPSASAFVRWARVSGVTLEWLAEGVGDYRSEGWGFESLRAHDCVETVDAQFWRIVGCQVFPDTLFPFPCEVGR